MVDSDTVLWTSKKQELVTLSTTEPEYVAQTHAAKEAIWLCRLLTELFGPMEGPTTLFSDSKSTIALAQNGHYHAQTKHTPTYFTSLFIILLKPASSNLFIVLLMT